MLSHHISERPEAVRSATWPPTNMPIPDIVITSPNDDDSFEHDLEQHPDRHFLSPIMEEEVYGWDSDSDDDSDDEGEWNAGIMDFSLFSADRKRAMETGEPLDGKWDSFVSNQAEAFERSVERVRESEDEDLPALTPDASPELKDDLEDEAQMEGRRMAMPQILVPDYLTVEIKPADVSTNGGAMIGPDDDLPLAFSTVHKPRVARPGLKYSRTMSGKRHVWRRPDEDLFTIGEDVLMESEVEGEDEDEMMLLASIWALRVGGN